MACRNISYEPCTLVYSLLDSNQLCFEDFSLIVRSLHSYMVEAVTPNPATNTVHVKLSYQASIINAQNKLGKLRNIIGISKLSQHVDQSELPRLEQLRLKYGLTGGENEPMQPRGRGNRGGKTRGIFRARPSPYPQKAPPTVTSPVPPAQIFDSESNFPDAQPDYFTPSDNVPEQSSDYYQEDQ